MVKAPLAEKKLLYRIRAYKDPDAFSELYDRYVNKIYRFVFLKLSDSHDAEDITSEVFLKSWHYLIDAKQPKIQSFSGLVYRIARNSVIDVYRKRANRQEVELETAFDLIGEKDMVSALQVAHDSEQVLLALKRLKTEYQEVIVFRYIDDLSIAEIADILGKNNTAVRVTIHRALKILKSIVKTP